MDVDSEEDSGLKDSFPAHEYILKTTRKINEISCTYF